MSPRSRSRRQLTSISIAALVGVLGLAACGGSSDDSSPEDDAGREPAESAVGDAVDGDMIDAAKDLVDQAIEDTGNDARATLVIDGTTYEFRALVTDDAATFSYCTAIGGSLQGGMQLVDDTGAPIEDGELSFILVEPGGLYDQQGDPPELSIVFPGNHGIGYTADEIDAPASGRSASGTFTASDSIGDTISGTIDASC